MALWPFFLEIEKFLNYNWFIRKRKVFACRRLCGLMAVRAAFEPVVAGLATCGFVFQTASSVGHGFGGNMPHSGFQLKNSDFIFLEF
jgi:hypothetical protein